MDTPVLVFDDHCGFCTYWADYAAERTDVTLVGFTELDDHPEVRERLPDDYEHCSHFVTDETVRSCGASMEEALSRTPIGRVFRPLVKLLRKLGPYRWLREWVYRRFSKHRAFWGRFTSKTPPARRAERSADGETTEEPATGSE